MWGAAVLASLNQVLQKLENLSQTRTFFVHCLGPAPPPAKYRTHLTAHAPYQRVAASPNPLPGSIELQETHWSLLICRTELCDWIYCPYHLLPYCPDQRQKYKLQQTGKIFENQASKMESGIKGYSVAQITIFFKVRTDPISELE